MTTQNFAVSDFVEYTELTREMRPSKVGDFADMAERRSMFITEFLSRPEGEMTDGGEPMIWPVHSRQANNKGGLITFGQKRTTGRTRGSAKCSVLHRVLENNESWIEAEVDYNGGDVGSHWLKLEDVIYNALDSNHLELWEDALLAVPDPNMESTSKGKFPHISIPAFVCPGASASATTATVPSNYGSVTTQMGLDTATNTTWASRYGEYSKSNPYGVGNGLIAQMKRQLRRLMWLGKIKTWSKRARWEPTAKSGMLILTGENGADLYEDCLDYRNDKTFAADDPDVPVPKIRGIELTSCQRIDELNLSHRGSTAYTAPYGPNDPPFWFLDMDHFKIKFHPKYKFRETIRPGDQDSWDRWATFRTSSGNTWSDLRNRHGLLCGSAA